MAPLKPILAAVALIVSTPAHADPVARWQPYIAEASARFGIPAPWIERVMRAESAGQTQFRGKPITSPAGAMGLMQLMPVTWVAMRAQLGLGADPYDPHDNILAGAFYLRLMYDRFGYPGLFAAYNAGPKRYGAFLDGKARLPGETRAYLAAVAGVPLMHGNVPARSAPDALFAVRNNEDAGETIGDRQPVPATGLFVIDRNR